MRENQAPLISLLVPVYNEESQIAPFFDAVIPVLEETGCPYEVIVIDDGSDDGTADAVRRIKERRSAVTLITLARNFGKEAALTAGIDFARGDVVIPIDADLQDPPDLIPQFLAKWHEGFDIVYGVRRDRTADGFFKRLSAKWFYALFNRISRLKIPADSGDFRLLDRRVVDEIKKLRERQRFMKALMSWPGFRAASVSFERAERSGGRSSWSFWRLWNFALDGITSFSSAPLRLWLYVGLVIALLSFVFGVYIIVNVLLTGRSVPGYASLMVAVIFFGGIQLMSVGLIGEYVGRLYEEVKGRPLYVIDSIED